MKNFVIVVLGFCIPALAAAYCDDIKLQSKEQRYVNHGNGTVEDLKTGLLWMSCAVGQTWDGSTCQGQAIKFDWPQSLNIAEGTHFAESSVWRLPNIAELKTIVEVNCAHPALNPSLFPNAPSSKYWSSSSSDSGAKIVDFAEGIDWMGAKDGQMYVRLVMQSPG